MVFDGLKKMVALTGQQIARLNLNVNLMQLNVSDMRPFEIKSSSMLDASKLATVAHQLVEKKEKTAVIKTLLDNKIIKKKQ